MSSKNHNSECQAAGAARPDSPDLRPSSCDLDPFEDSSETNPPEPTASDCPLCRTDDLAVELARVSERVSLLEARVLELEDDRDDCDFGRWDSETDGSEDPARGLGDLEARRAALEASLGDLEARRAALEASLGEVESKGAELDRRLGELEAGRLALEEDLGRTRVETERGRPNREGARRKDGSREASYLNVTSNTYVNTSPRN